MQSKSEDLDLGYLNIFDYPELYNMYSQDEDLVQSNILNGSVDDNQTHVPIAHQQGSSGKPDVWYWRVGLFAAGGSGICCAGVVCNVIAIIVLLNIRKKSSAPVLLISLACLESAFLLSYLFLENITLLSWGGLVTAGYADNLKPTYSILFPVPHIFQTCLAYLVVVITLERYVVVAWPFRARELCSSKSARTALICVVIYSVLYHIPTYAAFTYRKVWFNETKTWEYDFIRTNFGNSYFYNTIFIRRMHQIFNFGVPSALLLVFNTLLVVALRRSTFSGGSSADEARAAREKRLTLMVFSMTIIFMVVQLMEGIALAMLAGLSEYEEAPVPVNRFSAVADTLMLLNSATNFAIYCATGRQFRETFLRLFYHSWSCRKGRCFTTTASNHATKSRQEMHSYHKNLTSQKTLETKISSPMKPVTPVATRSSGFRTEIATGNGSNLVH